MRPAIAAALLLFGGCATRREVVNAPVAAVVTAWPDEWSKHLGRTMTVEGTAGNGKMGALLLHEDRRIWIDGLDAWPREEGRTVRATGTVIKRSDLPVFIERPGGLPQSGIPVPPGTDLEAARVRFLLKDAKWQVVGEHPPR